MRWVDKYKSTNNITRKKRDYKAYKMSNSHILFIKQQLKKKTITMDELLANLKTKYPDLELSRVHLGRVVRDINIPYHPQTNPIESYFSELKHYIKLDSKIEYNDLLKSIKKSIKKIKKSHYKNHFTNSLKNINYNKKINNYKPKKVYKIM